MGFGRDFFGSGVLLLESLKPFVRVPPSWPFGCLRFLLLPSEEATDATEP